MGFFVDRKMCVKKANAVKGHFALYDTKSFRSRCKMPGCTRFSHLFCEECKVHLCITSKRNCFYKYHHISQPEKNDDARQNKSTKDTRRSNEIANANEKRSSRGRTSGVVSKRKKSTPNCTATSTSANKKSYQNTRSQIFQTSLGSTDYFPHSQCDWMIHVFYLTHEKVGAKSYHFFSSSSNLYKPRSWICEQQLINNRLIKKI